MFAYAIVTTFTYPTPLPRGRFKEGAAVIHQQELKRVEAVGKNLFYMFAARDGVGWCELNPVVAP